MSCGSRYVSVVIGLTSANSSDFTVTSASSSAGAKSACVAKDRCCRPACRLKMPFSQVVLMAGSVVLMLVSGFAFDVWQAECGNEFYYRAESGRLVTQWPGSMDAFTEQTSKANPEDYEVAAQT